MLLYIFQTKVSPEDMHIENKANTSGSTGMLRGTCARFGVASPSVSSSAIRTDLVKSTEKLTFHQILFLWARRTKWLTADCIHFFSTAPYYTIPPETHCHLQEANEMQYRQPLFARDIGFMEKKKKERKVNGSMQNIVILLVTVQLPPRFVLMYSHCSPVPASFVRTQPRSALKKEGNQDCAT